MESRHQLWSLDINYGNFGHHLDIIWNLDIDLDINNEVYGHKLWTSIINIENCKTMEPWSAALNCGIVELQNTATLGNRGITKKRHKNCNIASSKK